MTTVMKERGLFCIHISFTRSEHSSLLLLGFLCPDIHINTNIRASFSSSEDWWLVSNLHFFPACINCTYFNTLMIFSAVTCSGQSADRLQHDKLAGNNQFTEVLGNQVMTGYKPTMYHRVLQV